MTTTTKEREGCMAMAGVKTRQECQLVVVEREFPLMLLLVVPQITMIRLPNFLHRLRVCRRGRRLSLWGEPDGDHQGGQREDRPGLRRLADTRGDRLGEGRPRRGRGFRGRPRDR